MQPLSFWFDLLVFILHAGSWIRYQMNPANYREALIETRLDEAEGADILMVKFPLNTLKYFSYPPCNCLFFLKAERFTNSRVSHIGIQMSDLSFEPLICQ